MRLHRKAVSSAAAAVAIAGMLMGMPAAAQKYPVKPVRVIVPFSAGGPADILARIIGEKLQRSLGQPIVVLNKDGAGTIVGVDLAAKSTADGYTLLLGNVAMIINAASGKKLPYDALKDLAPISLVFTQPLIVVVNSAVPAHSVSELVALAKAHPGKLKYGTSGVGTSIHLTTELFRAAVGIEVTHVPYKGVAPAMTDLLAGQTDFMVPGITAAVPHLKSGKLRALAVTSRKRSRVLSDVPTLIEAGVPNFDAVGWYGMLAPAGTPKAIIAMLNTELVRTLAMPDVAERLTSQGGDPASSSPEQFAAFMREELAKWRDVIRSAKIHVE